MKFQLQVYSSKRQVNPDGSLPFQFNKISNFLVLPSSKKKKNATLNNDEIDKG